MDTVNKVAVWVLIGVVVITGLMFGLPAWNVWRQGLSGEAALNKATQVRQIQIEQAKAEKEAAQYLADAIAIVGKASQEYPEYRQQMFIQGFSEALQEGQVNQIIYVPTEAMIPITEATRTRGN